MSEHLQMSFIILVLLCLRQFNYLYIWSLKYLFFLVCLCYSILICDIVSEKGSCSPSSSSSQNFSCVQPITFIITAPSHSAIIGIIIHKTTKCQSIPNSQIRLQNPCYILDRSCIKWQIAQTIFLHLPEIPQQSMTV